MPLLEENRQYALSGLAERVQASVNEWLLSRGERLQHVRVDAASYDTLQAKIVAAVDPKCLEREALQTVPAVPYHSPMLNAELLSNSTFTAVVVYDGLIALLSLLNEAYINVLLTSQTEESVAGRKQAVFDKRFYEALTTASPDLLANVEKLLAQGKTPERIAEVLERAIGTQYDLPELVAGVARYLQQKQFTSHMDRLVSLLLYWAIDPETDIDIPAIRAWDESVKTRPEAAMLTQYHQVFVVCHELGHFVLNWASTHPQVGSVIERDLASVVTELEGDRLGALTIRDALSWTRRILDERRSDHIATMLYRSFIDHTGSPEEVRAIAQAAPSLFLHYVSIADYLRDLSGSFQFESQEELLGVVGLRAGISSATHPPGYSRQLHYQNDTADWLSESSRKAISSIDRIMGRVWACAASPSELGGELWGSLLRTKREGESDGSR